MKKTLPSTQAPAADRGSPGPFSEAGPAAPGAGSPSNRQEVQQEPHREHVPGKVQRPAGRSKPLRKRRP